MERRDCEERYERELLAQGNAHAPNGLRNHVGRKARRRSLLASMQRVRSPAHDDPSIRMGRVARPYGTTVHLWQHGHSLLYLVADRD